MLASTVNIEKYDLVLKVRVMSSLAGAAANNGWVQDIVMLLLDGVFGTSLTRQFDYTTPIISMTSNSKADDITKYYSSSMNRIVPQLFTKDGLLEMFKVHSPPRFERH